MRCLRMIKWIVFVVLVVQIQVQALTDGNFKYTASVNTGDATVTGYNGTPPSDLIIPSKIGGGVYTVVSIGANAFTSRQVRGALVTVHCPGSLISIGNNAFGKCTKLKNVILPLTLKTIGNSSFAECRSLIGVDIPNVTSIGVSAFYRCSALSVPTLSEKLTVLNSKVFRSCTSFNTFNVSKTITSIASDTFSGCTTLANIEVDSDNPAYSSVDGLLYNKSKTTLILCPEGKA